MKVRKKPVEVEAIQYNGDNGYEIHRRFGTYRVLESPILEQTEDNPTGCYLQIETLNGWTTAIVGDWIIEDIKGRPYPCKPDIFELTYDIIEK